MTKVTRHRRPRLRLALLAAVAAVAAAVALTLRATDVLFPLELDSIDARFSVRGSQPPPADIVIVALDGRTMSELNINPSLIPRTLHARVLDRVHRDGPKLIGYDVRFVGSRGANEDRALLDAIRRAQPVLLATQSVAGKPLRVPAGETNPGKLGAHLGSVEIVNDEDGVTRVMPYYRVPPQAFAVVAAELITGERVAASDFPDGVAWIDFRGPPGTFRHYSLVDVVRGEVPRGTFKDKVVLVGATSSALQDVFPTPMSADPMPGVEIHANSLASILDDFPLSEAPGWLEVALALAMALLAPVIALRFSALLAVAGGLVAAILFALAAQLAFDAGTILPVTYPLVGLAVGTAGAAAVDLLLETRERRRLRHTLSRFVPEQVVASVLARTDDDLRLGGETLEATVLFCDLRGFSRFAERHSASTVIQTLNRYLTEMTEATFSHGGTVVSYMGDGLMAVFGAPVEQPDNPDRAVAAAREMLDARLPAFNEWLEERGFGVTFEMGIGMCTGPVMSGNVGSARRLEYTAVGDTTNVAARLQEKNKEFGSRLLMAESTSIRLGLPEEQLVFVGEHAIPGRTGKVRLWSIATHQGTAPKEAEGVIT
jgi:adenylate cyclase